MNYASLDNSPDEPGRVSDNSDWNIDYVYLNKGRNDHDTVIRDLAVMAPLPSLLSYYESIPWNHFLYAADELMASGKTSVYYHYYSPDPNENIGFNRSLQIKSLYTNYTDNYDSIGFNIHSGTTLLYEPYYQKLSYDGNDSAAFRVTFFVSDYNLKPIPALLYNDTVRRTQVFKDYYAYDDGSAENGYGLIGIGTANSRVAYKFFSYLPNDSLRAVEIYFNDVFHNANANLFNLTVWNSQDGIPKDTLLSRSDTSFYPVFQNRNHFLRYVLPKPIAILDTFYVGWIQNTDGFLNVGLDVNKISTQKMFYNIDGTWQQSIVKGSLMIRPIFGKRIVTGFHEKNVSASIKLYPNPASEVLNVELANNSNSKLSLFFYDLSGKLLLSSVSYGEQVNISSLPNGFYIVRIDTNQATSTFHKLRVLR